MKRKGFTLVELLVVIAIIALLMSILMPALSRVKQLAYRMMCGTHLSGIGRGMNVYAAENGDKFPIASHGQFGQLPVWGGTGAILDWSERTMAKAYGPRNEVTVTASLYLLVKYAEVSVDMFNCRGDAQAEVFSLAFANPPENIKDFPDAWDFGGLTTGSGPGKYCSYSYHYPYGSSGQGGYALSALSAGASPLCADRNPRFDSISAWQVYIDGDPGTGLSTGERAPYWAAGNTGYEYKDPDKTGNAGAHEREGQNVLFVDSHVLFAKTPCVGLANDHIYKSWKGLNGDARRPADEQDRQGANSSETTADWSGQWGRRPHSEKDACLVGESNTYPNFTKFP